MSTNRKAVFEMARLDRSETDLLPELQVQELRRWITAGGHNDPKVIDALAHRVRDDVLGIRPHSA